MCIRDSGSIDLIPEYNGALLANLLSQKVPEDVNTPDEVYAAPVSYTHLVRDRHGGCPLGLRSRPREIPDRFPSY